jgi:hypothetical protein
MSVNWGYKYRFYREDCMPKEKIIVEREQNKVVTESKQTKDSWNLQNNTHAMLFCKETTAMATTTVGSSSYVHNVLMLLTETTED